jgi:hypothetical protein
VSAIAGAYLLIQGKSAIKFHIANAGIVAGMVMMLSVLFVGN